MVRKKRPFRSLSPNSAADPLFGNRANPLLLFAENAPSAAEEEVLLGVLDYVILRPDQVMGNSPEGTRGIWERDYKHVATTR